MGYRNGRHHQLLQVIMNYVAIILFLTQFFVYRSVAEWVKQTEKAGVLDGSHSPPRTPPDSPAGSDSPTGFTNSTIVSF